MTNTTTCPTCYDTGTIDQGGAEVACPDCGVTVKLTGLRPNVAQAINVLPYDFGRTVACTSSTVTIMGTPGVIGRTIRDLRIVADAADAAWRSKCRGSGMRYSARNVESSSERALIKRLCAAR